MSAVDTDRPRTDRADIWPRPKQARVPESLRATDYAVWHPHFGETLCRPGGGASVIAGRQAGQPAHDTPHDGDPPTAFRGGHQHDPGMAGTRVAGNNQRVR